MPRPFLQAEWRKLAMVNYCIDPLLLSGYLPAHTELDLWQGRCYVSLVGFLFKDTRLLGWKIPFHSDFEEVNLRFYVRYLELDQWKRGVVFIKEIVPKPALTMVANIVYGEHYETMPMKHDWANDEQTWTIDYAWKSKKWNHMRLIASNELTPIEPGSEEEFITEHYWGYTKLSDTISSEYEVRHPRWQIYPVREYSLDVDYGELYGEAFAFLSNSRPQSVFLAEGSAIQVMKGRTIR